MVTLESSTISCRPISHEMVGWGWPVAEQVNSALSGLVTVRSSGKPIITGGAIMENNY